VDQILADVKYRPECLKIRCKVHEFKDENFKCAFLPTKKRIIVFILEGMRLLGGTRNFANLF
jgi:hypothetical protein